MVKDASGPVRTRVLDPDLVARHAAFDVFHAAVVDHRAVNDTFDPAVKHLDPRDRAFVRLLVATTLRRLGQIDAIIAQFVPRPPPDAVRDCLRLGAAQALFLGTPAHAAVATTVGLVRARHFERMTGLVNAVCRKIVTEGPALTAAQDQARLNCPDWLWQAWAEAYGEERAREIALAHLGEPPVDLTVKDVAAAGVWAEKLDAIMLPTGSLRRYATGRITELDGFKDGTWWVQDAAATMPAKILLHHLKDVGAKTIIDLCAAPGGKTAQLASAGYKVTSVDLAEERVEMLRANMVRLKLYADIVTADALTWRPPALVDAVLLDAPCSATGTIRRHPDLPLLKQPGDISGFARNQRRLLDAAAAMVRPGGLLLYSVCSLQPEEGDGVVNAVLAENPALTRVPISPEAVNGEAQLLTPDGALRTFPCHWAQQGGMDGFYGALLQKQS
jgi:16S rRNA (cytosine967-C5)-methyltransferase